MKAYKWLTLKHVLAIHNDLLKETGGAGGLRDRNLLESAILRPQNSFFYERQDNIFELAAQYMYGIIRNHPFIDGNKRVAYGAAAVFLHLNKYEINKELNNEQELLVQKLARGEEGKKDFVNFLRENSHSLEIENRTPEALKIDKKTRSR